MRVPTRQVVCHDNVLSFYRYFTTKLARTRVVFQISMVKLSPDLGTEVIISSAKLNKSDLQIE